MTDSRKHILVTGASSGIGAAIAEQQAARGHVLSLGARRTDRLPSGERTFCHALDVTDEASVEAFLAAAVAANGPIDVLVNNAGLARGTETMADADGVAWREMIETNVMGVLHMTRRVVPSMIERRAGHVVMIGSIAGRLPYENGSVYCATKASVRVIAQSLRQELFGTNVRVTTVDPGLVETEFSLVRFRGDAEKAKVPYENTRPLHAADVADCVDFAISRPPHVNIDDLLVTTTDQVSPTRVYRG
ncbi:MAG: SDR family NAD(P)-dependent oxidoreductase [Planctomycetes bacterium]|nr:SDR family NAD(P)-dependent oxidoreductase [Planctomycetota bacterium]